MSFPLQNDVPLYQTKTTAGQDMTGAGQLRGANGGNYTTSGASNDLLFGRLAYYSGGFNGYSMFPSNGKVSNVAGVFYNDKMHQNPPSQYGSEPTFSEGARVSVLQTGRVTVETIGTLTTTGDIYVYVGTTTADWGKLQNSSTAGVLISEYSSDAVQPMRLVSSEDGLAIVQINFS